MKLKHSNIDTPKMRRIDRAERPMSKKSLCVEEDVLVAWGGRLVSRVGMEDNTSDLRW